MGVGSRFECELKLGASNITKHQIPLAALQERHIQLILKQDIHQQIIQHQLQTWGARVTVAQSIEEALSQLEKNAASASSEYIDSILIDHDDYELVIESGVLIDSGHPINIVVMRSLSDRIIARRCETQKNCNSLTKPAMPNNLFASLDRTVSGPKPWAIRRVDEPVTEVNHIETETQWPSGTHILIVEDNTINQLVIRNFMEVMQVDHSMVNNGLEALNSLQKSDESKPFTLIIMDCQMPEMDGYQATKAIRAGQAGDEYRDITIIAMTANAMKGDREKCLDAGMNDYFTKPIIPEVVQSMLTKWLLGR